MQTLICGASSQVAHFLTPILAQAGHGVTAISRRPCATPGVSAVRHVTGDIFSPDFALPRHTPIDVVFHLPPIWAGPVPVAKYRQAGAAHLIAFSSASVLHRATSLDPADRAFAQQIAAAELDLQLACRAAEVALTLFRPTMMYGCGRDNNVAAMARFIRRFRFFPLIGEASGCRQPVHAADVAQACLASVLELPAAEQTYDLSGSEQLCFWQLVERVFQALELETRFLRVPRRAGRLAVSLARHLPNYRFLGPSWVDRMAQDQCQSHAVAAAKLGFAPRGFQLGRACF